MKLSLSAFFFLLLTSILPAQTIQEKLEGARLAMSQGKLDKAIMLVQEVIKEDPKNSQGYLLRGVLHEAMGQYTLALIDFDMLISLRPKFAEGYQRRGVANFKAGKIDDSISDFDRYIALNPKAKVSHWQRGISYYYAKKYKEGKEQFEGYQDYDSNDVENAVWRYLCMVPLTGKEKARKEILKIGEDKRIPMRQVYDLFAGKIKPEQVLQAARDGEPNKAQLNQRLFYAHLYLGLYYESEGDAKKAFDHLNQAAQEHPIGHYMWDVARVHRDILKSKLK